MICLGLWDSTTSWIVECVLKRVLYIHEAIYTYATDDLLCKMGWAVAFMIEDTC